MKYDTEYIKHCVMYIKLKVTFFNKIYNYNSF